MAPFWQGKKVFVTGASGFVGSHLVERLLSLGAIVTALVQDVFPSSRFFREKIAQRVQLVHGSLEEFGTIQRALCRYEIDTVFHLGAQALVETALRSPLDTLESNVRGTYYLLEACRLASDLVQRIVLASSDKAYGPSRILPYLEEMPSLGTHPYDVSKACGDLIARSYHKTYGLSLVIGRCANLYGGGDLHWSRIIPGTIRSILENRPIEVRSDGSMIREYLYVEEAIDAYLKMGERCLEKGVQGEIFNFGPDRSFSVLQVIDMIKMVMRREDIEVKIINKTTHEIKAQSLNSSKAKRLLGWSSKMSLEEGLKKTIDWYRRL
ncbi:MAG: GDP-mannose 4,6-dehydratase [Chlamydiae bacterium]|nr:GDP-mannose 4,6-dehydratase [Chlamydiota bacterium]